MAFLDAAARCELRKKNAEGYVVAATLRAAVT